MRQEEQDTEKELIEKEIRIRKQNISIYKERLLHEELCIKDLERELEQKDWSQHT